MDSRIEALIMEFELPGNRDIARFAIRQAGKALALIVLKRSLPDARDGSHEDAAFNAALGTAADVILRAVDVEKS